MTGNSIGHYRIVSKLGEGGMGEVYLAQDRSLGRQVALKILPEQLATNEQNRERFTQEARLASALSHPNIAYIYEVGEVQGTHFIVMEYVEGESLNQRLKE